MQLSTADAADAIKVAASAGHVGVTMHLVQHSPDSLWELLQSYHSIRPEVAAVLFSSLAERYAARTLRLPWQGCLCKLVQRAMSAGQPGPALVVLQAVAEAHQHEPEQQQEKQRPPLTSDDLDALLRTAAATGCPEVVMHLVQQGVDVWSLLRGPSQFVCTYFEERRLIKGSVAAVLFPYLVEQYKEGRLHMSCKKLAALVYDQHCTNSLMPAWPFCSSQRLARCS